VHDLTINFLRTHTSRLSFPSDPMATPLLVIMDTDTAEDIILHGTGITVGRHNC
jgi:hypothetical protein